MSWSLTADRRLPSELPVGGSLRGRPGPVVRVEPVPLPLGPAPGTRARGARAVEGDSRGPELREPELAPDALASRSWPGSGHGESAPPRSDEASRERAGSGGAGCPGTAIARPDHRLAGSLRVEPGAGERGEGRGEGRRDRPPSGGRGVSVGAGRSPSGRSLLLAWAGRPLDVEPASGEARATVFSSTFGSPPDRPARASAARAPQGSCRVTDPGEERGADDFSCPSATGATSPAADRTTQRRRRPSGCPPGQPMERPIWGGQREGRHDRFAAEHPLHHE